MDPDGSDYRLRRARPSDLPALYEMETSAFPGDRLSVRSFRHHLASPRADMFAVVMDDRVVAYALNLYRKGSTRARLYSIAVANEHRGRGLSVRLIDALERSARKRGCDRMGLEVRTDNKRAIDGYEHAGFTATGRIADYYDDGESALRMEKPLRKATARLAA